MTTLEIVAAARDLIKEKTKRIEKLGQKYEKCKFD
jgi:hypothetical protein